MTWSSSPVPALGSTSANRTAFRESRQPGEGAHDHEDAEDDPPRPDARQPGRLGVGAGRVDRAAGRQVAQAPGEEREAAERDRHDAATARPTGPAPNHWNVGGRSRTNSPSRRNRSDSRQITSVASVTTIDGRPSPATRAPLTAPMPPRPATVPSPTTRDRQPGLRQQAGDDAADAELRADRDVDLPAEDHQRHPDRGDQHRGVAHHEAPKLLGPEEPRGGHRQDHEQQDA